MGIGVSLILIAAGAILTWAVNATVSGVDINTVGVILMIVGAAALPIPASAAEQGISKAQSTELSSRHRWHRHYYRHWGHRHWGWRRRRYWGYRRRRYWGWHRRRRRVWRRHYRRRYW